MPQLEVRAGRIRVIVCFSVIKARRAARLPTCVRFRASPAMHCQRDIFSKHLPHNPKRSCASSINSSTRPSARRGASTAGAQWFPARRRRGQNCGHHETSSTQPAGGGRSRCSATASCWDEPGRRARTGDTATPRRRQLKAAVPRALTPSRLTPRARGDWTMALDPARACSTRARRLTGAGRSGGVTKGPRGRAHLVVPEVRRGASCRELGPRKKVDGPWNSGLPVPRGAETLRYGQPHHGAGATGDTRAGSPTSKVSSGRACRRIDVDVPRPGRVQRCRMPDRCGGSRRSEQPYRSERGSAPGAQTDARRQSAKKVLG